MVWTTAQGRFGRRLRATGIQHPAPTLTCMTNRDEDKLWVTAPYAVTVHAGKNVTADPPRTELWALLYAQVKQADDKDFRNILLDDRQLDWRVQVEKKKAVDLLEKYSDNELQVLSSIAYKNFKHEISATSVTNLLQLVDFSTKNKDGLRSTAPWSGHTTKSNCCSPTWGCPGLTDQRTGRRDLAADHKYLRACVRLDDPLVASASENLVAAGGPAALAQGATRAVANQTAYSRTPSPVSDAVGEAIANYVNVNAMLRIHGRDER
jgi:hypothetical protein